MSGPLQVAIALLSVATGLILSRGILGRPGRSRVVALVLGIDAGLVLVGGIALAAAAGRSWQLLGDPLSADGHPLVDVSRLDGDGNLFALFIVVIGLLTLLGTTLLTTAARSVEGTQPGDRAVVASVLWGEVVLAAYAVVRVFLGADGRPFVLLALHLPLSAVALLLQHRDRPALA